jgi:hypothetical protein
VLLRCALRLRVAHVVTCTGAGAATCRGFLGANKSTSGQRVVNEQLEKVHIDVLARRAN